MMTFQFFCFLNHYFLSSCLCPVQHCFLSQSGCCPQLPFLPGIWIFLEDNIESVHLNAKKYIQVFAFQLKRDHIPPTKLLTLLMKMIFFFKSPVNMQLCTLHQSIGLTENLVFRCGFAAHGSACYCELCDCSGRALSAHVFCAICAFEVFCPKAFRK